MHHETIDSGVQLKCDFIRRKVQYIVLKRRGASRISYTANKCSNI